MDAQQFAYWLNGFAELCPDDPPTPAQWKSIREHLALVFKNVTPPVVQPWFPFPSPTADKPLRPLRTECLVSVNDGCGTSIC